MVRLSPKRRRQLLIFTNVALAAALAAAVAAWALVSPATDFQEAASTQAKDEPPRHRTENARPAAAYAVIYQRDLRKPLFDAVAAVAAAPPKPQLNVTLMGTAVDPESPYGIFSDKSGRTRLVSVGQTIDGALVLEITDSAATVKFNGETITLRMKKENKP